MIKEGVHWWPHRSFCTTHQPNSSLLGCHGTYHPFQSSSKWYILTQNRACLLASLLSIIKVCYGYITVHEAFATMCSYPDYSAWSLDRLQHANKDVIRQRTREQKLSKTKESNKRCNYCKSPATQQHAAAIRSGTRTLLSDGPRSVPCLYHIFSFHFTYP